MLTEPLQRTNPTKCPYNGLCGGEVGEEINVLKSIGTGIPIQWKTINTKNELLCRLTLIHGISFNKNEETTEVLFPLDNSANEEGFFQCGQQDEAYELKIVNITSNFQSSKHVLKLEWTTGDYVFSTCADTMIMSPLEECEGGNPCCEKLYLEGILCE